MPVSPLMLALDLAMLYCVKAILSKTSVSAHGVKCPIIMILLYY